MMAGMAKQTDAAGHTMHCMEVWGGNQAADNGVSMPGLDAWVFSRPYKGESGGGDVHYVSSCATGRILRLLVADVSGHGQAVAEAAVALRGLMRRFVNYMDQTRFVLSLNKEFSRLAEVGSFATAVVATYWSPTDYLVACNAGHPRPLLYRARTRTWELLKAPVAGAEVAAAKGGVGAADGDEGLVNLPLGIAEPTGYDQFGVYLRRGDLVMIYTDSLIESRDAAGKLLGEQGLLEMVRGVDAAAPETLIPTLVERIIERAGGASLDDDMTVLLLRHNGLRPRRQALQGILAPFRIAGSVWERIRDGSGSPAGLPQMSLVNVLGAVVPAANRLWGRVRGSRD
jgi:sigma-B regulation protein RsbU (phosphoserine phosphatase)